MPIYEDTKAVLAMLKEIQQSIQENADLSTNKQVLNSKHIFFYQIQ